MPNMLFPGDIIQLNGESVPLAYRNSVYWRVKSIDPNPSGASVELDGPFMDPQCEVRVRRSDYPRLTAAAQAKETE